MGAPSCNVAVWCTWCQLPSVSREEAAFVEKGAFEELCVLIIDVRHSLKCLIKVIYTLLTVPLQSKVR